ncbi:MAG TPA: biotin--[acetyl-CoA-carboxylase] ligase [Treponemataceae bacterium]|jgi:BirA family biotin operon repressor/biotin-[acetyl-CoA-carboxylase] ligase|nr:biotin--[acetyl-CoA-carboxylase] ligase [Treponemataceae bacterium]HPX25212.1 biotin--[acetyl-CoA-carboxylase] ligase [Treponemataceae bacterium]
MQEEKTSSHSKQNLCATAIQCSILSQYKELTAHKIHIFDEIDSTNTEAKKRAQEEFHHGTVILAEKQTAGRGRLGRSFFSPSQSGLYMSVIYHVEHLDPMLITALSAVAVTRAIHDVYRIETSIKWVNDVFLDGKKVCGILTEGIINQQVKRIETAVIGIGINVYSSIETFPQDLHIIAGSLSHTTQVTHPDSFYKESRNLLCAAVLNNLFTILSSNTQTLDACIEEYRDRSFLIGKEVTVIKGYETFKARVINITKQAHLLIEKEDKTQEELYTGEVSIRL